ncbi:hypothetical protein Q3G72_005577 [Acer saccharum]|nr:hypothetical protein Q3G72_005577 [Acer saccharum]
MDKLERIFGLKPTIPAYLDPTYNIADFATGVCFASAGTGYNNATADVLSVIPLWKEMEYYKEYQETLRGYIGNEKANEVLGEALYLISIGTNDFLGNYYILPKRSSEYFVEEYQIFLAGIAENFITELYQLGARKICISGLPPVGCLPNMFSGSDCVEEYKDFNGQLQEMVMKLDKELPGIQIVLSSPYDIQDPNKFGKLSAIFFSITTVGVTWHDIHDMDRAI